MTVGAPRFVVCVRGLVERYFHRNNVAVRCSWCGVRIVLCEQYRMKRSVGVQELDRLVCIRIRPTISDSRSSRIAAVATEAQLVLLRGRIDDRAGRIDAPRLVNELQSGRARRRMRVSSAAVIGVSCS